MSKVLLRPFTILAIASLHLDNGAIASTATTRMLRTRNVEEDSRDPKKAFDEARRTFQIDLELNHYCQQCERLCNTALVPAGNFKNIDECIDNACPECKEGGRLLEGDKNPNDIDEESRILQDFDQMLYHECAECGAYCLEAAYSPTSQFDSTDECVSNICPECRDLGGRLLEDNKTPNDVFEEESRLLQGVALLICTQCATGCFHAPSIDDCIDNTCPECRNLGGRLLEDNSKKANNDYVKNLPNDENENEERVLQQIIEDTVPILGLDIKKNENNDNEHDDDERMLQVDDPAVECFFCASNCISTTSIATLNSIDECIEDACPECINSYGTP